jgi:hypothetical protein
MKTRLLIVLAITCVAQFAQARPITKQTVKASSDQTEGTTQEEEKPKEEEKPYVEDEADKMIKVGWKEKIRQRLENLDVEASEKKGFTPQIGTIDTTSGIAVGGAFRSQYLQAAAAFSYRLYQEYSVQAGIGAPRPGFLVKAFKWSDVVSRTALHRVYKPFFLYGDFRYRYLPKQILYLEPFGNDDFVRTGYLLKETSITAVTGYQFDQHVRVDLRVGLVRTNAGEGKEDQFPDADEFLDPEVFPEVEEPLKYLLIMTGLVWDNRDLRGNPHSGQVVGVSFANWNERDTDLYDFNLFNFDARQFIPLWSPKRTLALRFLTILSSQGEDKRIPFYLQPTLGGSHTLRGFPRYRFIGNHVLAGTVEYRHDVTKWLEVAPFYDFGKAFDDRGDFDFSDLEHNFGIGFRIKTARSVLFRFDIGHSDETTELRGGFSSAF